MPALASETHAMETERPQHTVLELTVNNHAGVMSHVCGLFARRAYNVEGILCMPLGDDQHSRIWLLVKQDQRLEQMVKQFQKLVDVIEVRHHEAEHEVFVRLEQFFRRQSSLAENGGVDC